VTTQTLTSRPGLERMSPAEWRRLGGFYAVVLLLHVLGWGTFLFFVLPSHYRALGFGTAVLAYTFGLRHAFDADHISAIDNTTRKLMADGQRPMGVGFFFSLGHSTVVFALAVGLAIAARNLAGAVTNQSSTLHSTGGLIGTLVSGGFLYLIGILNLLILLEILRVFREMREGRYDDHALEKRLNDRGLLYRFFGPLARRIDASWKMYPLGVLFGLGFDTATEVSLLAITAGAAGTGLPFYVILCLPVIFAAGMSMMDTADGAFMSKAYGWAFSNPVRKVYYNITITGLSVAVALVVGSIEIVGLLAGQFNWSGRFWDWVSKLDLNILGFFIVGMFALTWAIALLIWKLGHVEERWSQSLAQSPGTRGTTPAVIEAPAVEHAQLGTPATAVPGVRSAGGRRPSGSALHVSGGDRGAGGDDAVREQRRLEKQREARQQASYRTVEAACPVPVRRDRVALPAGLSYFDDEFVVAATDGDELTPDRVVLTTQRLVRSHGQRSRHHEVVNLEDVRSVGFHEPRFSDSGKVVLETVGGITITVPALDEIISRDALLALVRSARSRELPGVEVHERIGALAALRDSGAITADEYDAAKATLLSRL
jgi:nickel/cobalt transporter (NiCoT) family protein